MGQSKVYVVEFGEYSGAYVDSVWTTRELAEEWAGDSGTVTEMLLLDAAPQPIAVELSLSCVVLPDGQVVNERERETPRYAHEGHDPASLEPCRVDRYRAAGAYWSVNVEHFDVRSYGHDHARVRKAYSEQRAQAVALASSLDPTPSPEPPAGQRQSLSTGDTVLVISGPVGEGPA